MLLIMPLPQDFVCLECGVTFTIFPIQSLIQFNWLILPQLLLFLGLTAYLIGGVFVFQALDDSVSHFIGPDDSALCAG